MRTSHDESCPEIGPICAIRPEPPQVHDQSIALGELRLAADYAFDEALSAQVVLPLRAVSSEIVFRDLQGRRLDLDYENIHHRDEVIAGPGDPWLTGAFRARRGGRAVGARLGFTLPLGRTEADPFRAAEEGETHQHVQLGTGTVMPIAGVDLAQELGGPVRLETFALAVLSAYESARGYRPGHRFAAGALAAVRGEALGLDGATLRLGLEGHGESAEAWQGTVHTTDGNQGRFDLLAAAGLEHPLGAGLSGRATLRVPLVTHVVGGQLSYPAALELGVARGFDL